MLELLLICHEWSRLSNHSHRNLYNLFREFVDKRHSLVSVDDIAPMLKSLLSLNEDGEMKLTMQYRGPVGPMKCAFGRRLQSACLQQVSVPKKHALTLTVPADQGTCFSPRYQLQSSEVMQTIPLATEVYSGTLYACEGMPMQKGATWTCVNTSALSSRP